MKKTVVVSALILMLAACASTNGINKLSTKQLNNMTPAEVSEYYANENKYALDKILYDYGGTGYEAAEPVFTQMNAELNALSKQKIAKTAYTQKVNAVVAKYQQKLDYALKNTR